MRPLFWYRTPDSIRFHCIDMQKGSGKQKQAAEIDNGVRPNHFVKIIVNTEKIILENQDARAS